VGCVSLSFIGVSRELCAQLIRAWCGRRKEWQRYPRVMSCRAGTRDEIVGVSLKLGNVRRITLTFVAVG
jgi:hypothetical protein